MGHNWTHGVLINSQSTAGDRLVLLALAESADIDSGECFPSIKTIASRANMSERATQYSLRKLEKSGEIATIQGQSRYSTNIYRLSKSLLFSGVQNLHPSESRGATHCTSGVQPTAPEPSVEPSDNTYSAKSKRTGVPDNWWPTEDGSVYAVNHGMGLTDVDTQIEKFILHHQSKGTVFKDINKGWQTWCINFEKWGKGKGKDSQVLYSEKPYLEDTTTDEEWAALYAAEEARNAQPYE